MGVLEDIRKWMEEIPLWQELKTVPRRMDELETRIAALEKSLERAPGEVCPKCGAPAMRLKSAGRRLGGKDAFRFDEWACTSAGCDHSEQRKVVV
jgi:hypothetical protein